MAVIKELLWSGCSYLLDILSPLSSPPVSSTLHCTIPQFPCCQKDHCSPSSLLLFLWSIWGIIFSWKPSLGYVSPSNRLQPFPQDRVYQWLWTFKSPLQDCKLCEDRAVPALLRVLNAQQGSATRQAYPECLLWEAVDTIPSSSHILFCEVIAGFAAGSEEVPKAITRLVGVRLSCDWQKWEQKMAEGAEMSVLSRQTTASLMTVDFSWFPAQKETLQATTVTSQISQGGISFPLMEKSLFNSKS